jgi:hypothetical protein
MMRRVVYLICGMLPMAAACGALKAQVGPQSNAATTSSQTAASPSELDSFAAKIAEQIEKRHLKTVKVIGATGPKNSDLTQDGKELGDQLSAALGKHAQGFQVLDRATLRNSLNSAGVSDAMLVSDALANWIARKIAAAGYVVIQITGVSNGRASIVASLFKKGQDEGDLQTVLRTNIELSAEQKRDGFRPHDSNWNNATYSIEQLSHLPADRKAVCSSCPHPQFT